MSERGLVEVITADHRAMEDVFTELDDTGDDLGRRRDLADYLIAELMRHGIAEEEFMLPAARRRLADGDAVADRILTEHRKTEHVLKRLKHLRVDDARFDPTLRELKQDVRRHMSDEETELLPRLAEACTAPELEELGGKVLRAKTFAPTRPHPLAPHKPPANRIVGTGTGMIDRLRDTLAQRRT